MRRASSVATALFLLGAPSAVGADDLSVMTYNVRGLPPQVIEDRTEQMAAIAPRLEDFHTTGGTYEGIDSIVLLQELFYQPFYDTLTDDQTVSYPFITPKSLAGTFQLGDGVNSLSDFAFTGLTRVPWEECFGTQGANGSDCDTPKGFFFARYALATGATVDVYDLHADAGQDEGSRAARRDNIAQIIAAVNANSPEGQALIIAGDTNSLYTKTPNDLIETVLSDVPGIKDVWVELVNGGVVPSAGADIDSGCDTEPAGANCELIDKVFYRSGDDVTITPTAYDVPRALMADQTHGDLSDHFPVTVRFTFEVIGATTTTVPTSTSVPSSTSTTVPSSTTTVSQSTSTTVTPTTSTTVPSGGTCGDPAFVAHALVSGPRENTITASDALFVLKTAVGSATCALCVCDVDGNGSVSAGDALRTLKKAVGQGVTLSCPAC